MNTFEKTTASPHSEPPRPAGQVWLRACRSYVPEKRVSADDAVAAGWYQQEDHDKDGYLSIAVEDDKWPAEMARLAGQDALRQAGIGGDQVGFLSYASLHRHGHARFWQPAAYLQGALGAPGALAFSLQHGCNGLFVAARLALDYLQRADGRDALLIGADRFGTSSMDRWSGDYGVVYGDAAVALLLSARRGFARLLHLEVESVPALEGMHRHGAEHVETASAPQNEYGIRASKRAFMARHGRAFFFDEIRLALLRLRAGLLERYDLAVNPADWLITPYVGRSIVDSLYGAVFADLARGHCGEFGRQVGHTGTSDQFLGLADLVQSGRLAPGQRVLLIGAGAGFSCSAMLVEAAADLSQTCLESEA